MTAPVTLSVPDLSCGHCRASIDAALAGLGASARYDMAARRVTVSGTDGATAVAALDRIGFPARPAD